MKMQSDLVLYFSSPEAFLPTQSLSSSSAASCGQPSEEKELLSGRILLSKSPILE